MMFNPEDSFCVRLSNGLLVILLGFMAWPFFFVFPWAMLDWGAITLVGIVLNGLAGWLLSLISLQNLLAASLLHGVDLGAIYEIGFICWKELINIPIYLAFIGVGLVALLGWFIIKYDEWSVVFLFFFALIALNPPFSWMVALFVFGPNFDEQALL